MNNNSSIDYGFGFTQTNIPKDFFNILYWRDPAYFSNITQTELNNWMVLHPELKHIVW
jgi:hypothetical protein